MGYTTMAEIASGLYFELDADSVPTADQVSGLWSLSNQFINGYLGEASDISDTTSGLRYLEYAFTMQQIDGIVNEHIPRIRMTPEYAVILNRYRKSKVLGYKSL